MIDHFTIDWGDEQVETYQAGGVKIFSGSEPHTFADEIDQQTIILTAFDNNEDTIGTSPIVITIADAPIYAIKKDVFGYTGMNATPDTAHFTEPNPLATAQDFTATIDWGDQSPSQQAKVIADAVYGGFKVQDTQYGHIYASSGIYTVTTTILDDPSQPINVTSKAYIRDQTTGDQIGPIANQRVDIHGVPLPDPSPTGEGESDRIPNMAYVDAFSLTPNFSTTDIAVPMPGGDLTMEFRRTQHIDSRTHNPSASYISESRWDAENLLGPGWSTNIGAHILITNNNHPSPGEAYTRASVVDDVGNTSAYVLGTTGNSLAYFPDVQSSFTTQSLHGTLTGNASYNGISYDLCYTEQFGTRLFYKEESAFQRNTNVSETFCRLEKVVDRNGNELDYKYPAGIGQTLPTSVIDPSTLTANSDPANPNSYRRNLQFKYNTIGFNDSFGRGWMSEVRLKSVTDPEGKVFNYNYDVNGQLSTVTKPQLVAGTTSPTINFTYSLETRVNNIIDIGGLPNTGSQALITWYLPSTIIDGRNTGITQFTYVDQWTPIGIQDQNSTAVGLIQYKPRLSSVQTSDGTATFDTSVITNLTFSDFLQKRTTITDTRGVVTTYQFGTGADHELVSAPNTLGTAIIMDQITRTTSGLKNADGIVQPDASVVYRYSQNIDGNLIEVTDVSGNTISYSYDSGNSSDLFNATPFGSFYGNYYQIYSKPSSRTVDAGSGNLNLTTLYTYDVTYKKETSTTDPAGITTEYVLDSKGNRIAVINGCGSSIPTNSTYTYDSSGFMTRQQDAAGRITDYSSDYNGNLDATTVVGVAGENLNLVTSRTADVMNHTLSQTDPSGNVTTFVMDNWYRVTQTRMPAIPNPTWDPQSGTAENYIIPSTQETYDANSNVLTQSDADGNVTINSYDPMNRLTAVRRLMAGNTTTSAADLVTNYAYDAIGLMKAKTDPNGNVTHYKYDAMLRQIEVDSPFVTVLQDPSSAAQFPLTKTENDVTKYYYGINSGSGAFMLSGFNPTRVVDSRGYATDTTYDGAYRATKVLRRVNPIGTYNAAASNDPAVAGDLQTDTIYNKDGKVVETVLHNIDATANRRQYTFYDQLMRPTVVVLDNLISINPSLTIDNKNPLINFINDPNTTFYSTSAEFIVSRQWYNPDGQITQSADPIGNITQQHYDGAGRLVQTKSPAVSVFVPGSNGLNTTVTAGFLPTTTTVYDKNSNPILVTDPNGNQTRTIYDALNHPIEKIVDLDGNGIFDPTVGSTSDIVTYTGRDLVGNAVFSIDPLGHRTDLQYDRNNRPTLILEPAVGDTRPQLSTAYDKNGNVIQTQDANVNVTSNSYDQLNRLRYVTQNSAALIGTADRAVAETRYDADGNIIATSKQNWVNGVSTPQITTYSYDGFGRKTQISQPNTRYPSLRGVTSTIAYDNAGNILSQSDLNGNFTQFAYDVAGRKTKMTQPAVDAGTPVTHYFYDYNGNLTLTTDPRNAYTRYEYDALNRRTSVIQADPAISYNNGPTTHLFYDPNGNLTRVVDPRNNASVSVYDRANRKTLTREPDPAVGNPTSANAPVTHFSYDNAGNPISTIDANQNATVTAYDALNRKVTVTQTDPATSTIDGGSPVTSCSYDANGNVTSIRDPLHNITHFAYDHLNRKTIMQQPAVGSGVPLTSYTFDAVGNLLSTVDPLGSVTAALYDNLNRKIATSQTTSAGAALVTSYFYDAVGNLLTTTDPQNHSTLFAYDALNRRTLKVQADPSTGIASASDPDCPATTSNYDLNGNLTSTIDPLHGITRYTYDFLNRKTAMIQADPANGSIADVSDSSCAVTSYHYDADGNLTSTIDPKSHATNYAYDALNRKIAMVQPQPDTGVALPIGQSSEVTKYAYDAVGNMTRTVDPRGAQTAYLFDALNRKVGMYQANPTTGLAGASIANSSRTSYGYDLDGNLLSTTDPLNHTISYSYDALHHKTLMIQPDAGNGPPITTYAYDKSGNVTAITDPLGHTTRFAYDAQNRKTLMVVPSPDGIAPQPQTTYAYDLAGNLTDVTDPLNHVTHTSYDALNRKTAVTLPATSAVPSTTLYVYDLNSNLTSSNDALNQVTATRYDALNRRILVTSPSGSAGSAKTAYSYDVNGNLSALKVATGTTTDTYDTTHYSYDALNRQITDTNQLGQTRTYAYDADGNNTSETDRDGRTSKFEFDYLNRKTAEKWLSTSGGVVRTMVSQFDADGQLSYQSDPSSTMRYGYDPAGRVLFTNNGGTPNTPETLLYQAYDLNGNLLAISTTVNGLWSYSNVYQYDDLNRQIQVIQSSNGTNNDVTDTVADKVAKFAYDSAGNLTDVQRFNDAAGTIPVANSHYQYNDQNLVFDIASTNSHSSDAFAEYTWEYDADSRTTSTAANSDTGAIQDGVTTYSYDANQLAAATTTGANYAVTGQSYSYDKNGNRIPSTGGTYTPPVDNRVASDGTYNYTYDAEGNTLSRITQATGDKLLYGWDYRNRLTSVTDENAAGLVRDVTTYAYDQSDRRISKQATQPFNQSTVVNRRLFYGNYASGQTFANVLPVFAGQTASTTTQIDHSINGIDGIVIDIAGLAGRIPAASDFEIKVFKPNTLAFFNYSAYWSSPPVPQIAFYSGAGINGSDRVVITYPQPQPGHLGYLANAWVQVAFKQNSDNGLAADDIFYFGNEYNKTLPHGPLPTTPGVHGATSVVNRQLFYVPSNYDSSNSNFPSDSIASDLNALMPGQVAAAGGGNISAYSAGIDGLVVDVAGLNGSPLSAADFNFSIKPAGSSDFSQAAPAPSSIQLYPGQGANGSDRVAITWAPGSIVNAWLSVTVLANTDTGLPAADTFYFGSVPGDINSDGTFNPDDTNSITFSYTGPSDPDPAVAGGPPVGDFNNDGFVDMLDLDAAGGSPQYGGPGIGLLDATVPALPAVPVPSTLAGRYADATPLLPGQTSSSANAYMNTGTFNVGFDIANIDPSTLHYESYDISVKIVRGNNPANWGDGPSPDGWSVDYGQGAGGSDRLTFSWTNNVLNNCWVQVTLHGGGAGSGTGLPANDVFYVGVVDPGATTPFAHFTAPVAADALPASIAGFESYVYGVNSTSDDMLLTADSNGTVTHRFLDGPTAHMVMADENTGIASNDPNRVQWLLSDNQQSVRDVVNNNGTLLNHITYDSYGNVIYQSDPAHTPRFTYTGMQRDGESNLLYDFHRYYDPKQGKFISQDPSGFAAGDSNLYRYVGNNPLGGVDPTGLVEMSVQQANLYSQIQNLQSRRDYDIAQNNGQGKYTQALNAEIANLKQEFQAVNNNSAALASAGSFIKESYTLYEKRKESVGKAVVQQVLQVVDTANLIAQQQTYGKIGYRGNLSDLANAGLDDKFDFEQNARRATANFVTFGTAQYAYTAADYLDGKIGEDEAWNQVGTTGLMQAIGGAVAKSLAPTAPASLANVIPGEEGLTPAIANEPVPPGGNGSVNNLGEPTPVNPSAEPNANAAGPESQGGTNPENTSSNSSLPAEDSGTNVNRNNSGCFRAGTLVLTSSGMVPIETIRPGNRVLTSTSDATLGEIDPAQYRLVNLAFGKDTQEFRMSFIRRAEILDGYAAGDLIDVRVLELKIKGQARVLSVEPCPPISAGPGRIVIGAFNGQSYDVRKLKLTGIDEPVEITGNHPVFSEDRTQFVTADNLQTGEKLRTRHGVATIESIQKTPGHWDVFNLEVDDAHQYYVGESHVLVHNQNGVTEDGGPSASENVAKQDALNHMHDVDVEELSHHDQQFYNGETQGQTGAYKIKFESGKEYSGKGSPNRAVDSAMEKMNAHADTPMEIKYEPANNAREDFKTESKFLQESGGPSNTNNYNKIESPGKQYLVEDGESSSLEN